MSFLKEGQRVKPTGKNLFFHNSCFSVSYQLIVLVGNGSPEYNPMFGIVFFKCIQPLPSGYLHTRQALKKLSS